MFRWCDQSAITNFNNVNQMNNNSHHKNQIQSLSSLSLEHNLNPNNSQLLGQTARKSSFDLVNFMGESQHGLGYRSKLEKSLDLLNSSLANNKNMSSPMHHFLNFTQEDRHRLQKAGVQPSQIDQIESQNDSNQQDYPPNSQEVKPEPEVSSENNHYITVEYLSEDLAKLLTEKQIPFQYVRGLLRVRDQKQIKSIRRLKVQRYLQKRRKKTWDKKICYNCRQKVAEERLRIKGKFIKKRRAMQILGLATPISTSEVKQRLQEMLKDKTLKEIEEIIKKDDHE